MDLINVIKDKINGQVGVGGSYSIGNDLLSTKDNFIDYDYAVKEYSASITNTNHRNYIVGAVAAHELTHQIVQKCTKIIQKASGNYKILEDICGNHCVEERNLMFPSNGFQEIHRCGFHLFQLNEKEQKKMLKEQGFYTLFVTGAFFPFKNNPNITSPWEVISPTFKFIISAGLLLNELKT